MPDDEGSSEFPAGIGRVARLELALHGYTRFDQLARVTASDLLTLHGLGPKAVRILGEHLAARGESFRPEPR